MNSVEPHPDGVKTPSIGDEIQRVLRENGLTDTPGEYDGDIHSWRCSYPKVYGQCSCFADLVADLVALFGGDA